MSVTRKVLAFALAPALPALYFVSMPYLTDPDYAGGIDSLVLWIAMSVSYLSTLVLGAPLIWILRKRRLLNILFLSIGAAGLGAVVLYAFGFGLAESLSSSRGFASIIGELTYGAVFGVLVAIPFGLIAGYPLIGTAEEPKE